MELSKLTVAELKAVAEELGVDLTGLTKKADIMAAVSAAAEEEVAMERDAQETEQVAEAPEERLQLTYIGPNIPGGLLTTGRTLWGTQASIDEYIEPAAKVYPNIKKLLIPADQLQAVNRAMKNQKHYLHQLIREIKDTKKK